MCSWDMMLPETRPLKLQFLNFQDLSFQGVSVSSRHCTSGPAASG